MSGGEGAKHSTSWSKAKGNNRKKKQKKGYKYLRIKKEGTKKRSQPKAVVLKKDKTIKPLRNFGYDTQGWTGRSGEARQTRRRGGPVQSERSAGGLRTRGPKPDQKKAQAKSKKNARKAAKQRNQEGSWQVLLNDGNRTAGGKQNSNREEQGEKPK